MKKAILYLAVFLLIQLGMGLIWPVIETNTDWLKSFTQAQRIIMVTAIANVLTMLVFLICRWAVLLPNYLRQHPWGVFFWSVIAALGCIIPSEWLQEIMPKLPNLMEDEFDMILKDRYGYIVVGLLAPLVEEIVFRGAILKSLLKWQKDRLDVLDPNKERRTSFFTTHWFPIALSALLFALIHANPVQMPHAFLMGLLLGWMYSRTYSIIPGIIVHWVNNTVAYIFYNLYPAPDLTLKELYGGSDVKVWLSLAFSILILVPAIIQLNMLMKRK